MEFGKLTCTHRQMRTPKNNLQVADRFGIVAKRFCSIVDSAPSIDRTELVERIYRVLPKLIDQAIAMPDVELSKRRRRKPPRGVGQHEWQLLYQSLQEKLGDWNLYRQVFNPTQDTEAIFGSLADDISDIYDELKKGLELNETSQSQPEDAIWEWKFSFQIHWGKHVIDALLAIYFRLQNLL
jgi:Domain of unknown function (DUF5063)